MNKTDPDYKFKCLQIRVLKKYCKLHPELSNNEACLKFIQIYAKRLREWYEEIQSHTRDTK